MYVVPYVDQTKIEQHVLSDTAKEFNTSPA